MWPAAGCKKQHVPNGREQRYILSVVSTNQQTSHRHNLGKGCLSSCCKWWASDHRNLFSHHLQDQTNLPLLNPSCNQAGRPSTNSTHSTPPRPQHVLTCYQATVVLRHRHARKVQLSPESWLLLLLLLLLG